MTELATDDGLRDHDAQPAREIPFAFPGLPGISCCFSTALTGNISLTTAATSEEKKAAAINRKKLLERNGLCAWVELRQVHKDGLIADPAPTSVENDSELEADGSCTRRKGVALAIKTADCQPILLASAKGDAIAALHAGWRGNVMNFPASGVRRFCDANGIGPGEVLAVRGPSLGPGAAEFVNFEREWPSVFEPWFDREKRRMDLWSLTRHQLVEAGLKPGNIFSLDLCSYSLHTLFFSHRRGHSGRQASLIWIREHV